MAAITISRQLGSLGTRIGRQVAHHLGYRLVRIWIVPWGMGDLSEARRACPAFAHPTEEAFARILDYYGIEWEYEPRTFVLERDEEGNTAVGFSPDFYLPQQDLYVELTTVRPSLVTIKNRKVRRLRELYPDVNIKLFKRRDVRDLMIKYGLDRQAERILGTEAQEEP